MRLLVVEDNKDVAELLFDFFESHECELDYAPNGKQAINQALGNSYDAIILDVMLPGMTGLEICKRLRESNILTPIVMLTALDTQLDEIAGLEHGADDYVIKPFDTDVLLARVKAAVRRTSLFSKEVTNVVYNNLTLNVNTRKLSGDIATTSLSPIQASLLIQLIKSSPEAASRKDLEYAAWQYEQPDADLLRRYIYQLRNRLELVSEDIGLETIPKFGYKICSRCR